MAYLLVAIAAGVFLVGLAKVSRNTQPTHDVPWGSLFIWALLFGGGLLIWLLSARIH
jgi:hypothetical protein